MQLSMTESKKQECKTEKMKESKKERNKQGFTQRSQ